MFTGPLVTAASCTRTVALAIAHLLYPGQALHHGSAQLVISVAGALLPNRFSSGAHSPNLPDLLFDQTPVLSDGRNIPLNTRKQDYKNKWVSISQPARILLHDPLPNSAIAKSIWQPCRTRNIIFEERGQRKDRRRQSKSLL